MPPWPTVTSADPGGEGPLPGTAEASSEGRVALAGVVVEADGSVVPVDAAAGAELPDDEPPAVPVEAASVRLLLPPDDDAESVPAAEPAASCAGSLAADVLAEVVSPEVDPPAELVSLTLVVSLGAARVAAVASMPAAATAAGSAAETRSTPAA